MGLWSGPMVARDTPKRPSLYQGYILSLLTFFISFHTCPRFT